jgi:S-formylglutathione hydrolase FrmB
MHRENVLDRGTLHRFSFESSVLTNNPLGDSFIRDLYVYVPFGGPSGVPLLVDLPGFNSAGPDHVSRRNIGENVPERLDRLIGGGLMPACVVVFPDCMTSLGGNQYINSAGTGQYADYLINEIVPFVEKRFSCGGFGQRGIFGKSSGGFGALWHGMNRPDFWSAVSCNSGDMDFEAVYRHGIYAAVRTLERWDRSVQRFFEYVDSADKVTLDEKSCRMHLALGATYDPDPNGYRNVRLPCDLRTANFDRVRWQRWLAYDPVLQVSRKAIELKKLRALWIDCGSRDEYFLNFGARRLSDSLKAHGIPHVYEEFDDTHLDVDYRMNYFLPFMARALEQPVQAEPQQTQYREESA